MAELGLVLSIASLIKLSTSVLTSCIEYVNEVKNAPTDINKIINEVAGLEFILKQLSSLASTDINDGRISSLPVTSLSACEETLGEMAGKLAKIPGSGVMRRRLLWPFEKEKLENMLSGLEKHKATFTLALTGKLLEEHRGTNDMVSRIEIQMEDQKILEERKMIGAWLRSVDPSTNHNAARKAHEPGTGDWLLNLEKFKNWRDGEGGILWLHGIPGAGKTVLSSTVVEHLKKQKEESNIRMAYYYFDFNDHAKQTAQGCFQSLLLQLFEQSPMAAKELRALHDNHRHTTPSLEAQTEVLIAMLRDGPPDYIVIDALDECSDIEGGMERESFFEELQKINSAAKGDCKIFLASRPEPDIKHNLSELGVMEISVENALVDEDIRSKVRSFIPKQSRWKKWPESVKSEIENALVKQSNGMFRWAACQLDVLKLSMKPANALKQLQNLPKDLAGTYTRILQRVPEDNEREMKTILMLLAFSTRPMTIQEVAEATAVDLESQSFSAGERFGHAYDILDVCSSLVSLADLSANSILKKEMRYKFNWDEDIKIVQFAHFSVKEFILSDVARKTLPDTLHINEVLSRSYLTEMCLIYLLDFNGGKRASKIDHREFPFLGYAALHWTTHLTLVSNEDRERTSKLLLRLFDPGDTGSLMNYLNLYNPISSMSMWESRSTGNSGRILNFGTTYRNKQDFETPLYYACYYGIIQVVDALLGEESSALRNTEELGSPLAAAASMGQDELVRRLLGMGADPNSRYCAQFFRPIHAAAKSGKSSIINMLLEAGADISNASYGPGYPLENGTALHLAAREGNIEVIQALIDGGHEVNYVLRGTGEPGTALAVAAQNGHDNAITCLIRNGADPRLYSHWHNYPLNLAAEKCSLSSVEAILDAGADIQGARDHNPLHEAAVRGDIGIMKLLLNRGADINFPGNTYGTPLKGAIQSRDAAVFKFMLDHGADINQCGSSTMYPVDQAIFGGNVKAADILLSMDAKFSNEALAEALGHETKEYLVQPLLKKGADPNAEHERQGNMLQLAIQERCQADTIRWLLEAGADVNAVEGEHGTALQMAVENEQEEIVDLLFEHGAEINLPACGTFGNPLQAAIANKLENVIRLLLEKGADIHAQGGRYWTILQTAAKFGNEGLVKLLLGRGVDVDAIGGEFGTALRAAVAMEHESIVKLLLDAGTQVNIEATASHSTKADSFSSPPFHSTLEVAIASCNTSIFKLLDNYGMARTPKNVEDALVRAVETPGVENKLKMLDCLVTTGADVKRYGGQALLYACSWSGKTEVVKLLLSLGAPIDWTYESAAIGSPLMHAIDNENKMVTQVLLDAGADVNLAAGETGTALITAVDKGNKELAFDLLERRADPNIKAGKYGTALAIAAKKGDEDVFFELLRKGADVNVSHGYYGTALHAAIMEDYYNLAHELLDRGASPTTPGVHASPLITACGYGKIGQLELVKRLISLDVDLEAFDRMRPEDENMGFSRWLVSALQNAAKAGNEPVVELLLNAGANINAVGEAYGTALQLAVKENKEGIVRLLLQRGADVNTAGGELHTPLQVAASEARVVLVDILLQNGADINIEGGKYGSALQAACTTSRSQVVEDLLSRGAKVNMNSGKYGNPLQAAAHHGHLSYIKTLLAHGADINLAGGEYGFALQAAACSDRCDPREMEVLRFVLENGADVNALGGEYGTALQAAAFHHKQYVDVLLDFGADPSIEGGKYGSAIGAAKEKGWNRVVKLLRQRVGI